MTAASFVFSAATLFADVTLSSKFGNLTVTGELIEFDAGFYTLRTEDGILTLREMDVTCRGTDCPVLDEFAQAFSILPGHQIDKRTLLKLLNAFAVENEFRFLLEGPSANPDFVTISDPAGFKLAQVGFTQASDQLKVTTDDPEILFATSVLQIITKSPEGATGLTPQQVLGLWQGTISDWSDIGGVSGRIRIIAPAFTEELRTVLGKFTEDGLTQYGSQVEFFLGSDQILSEIQNDETAIGFVLTSEPLENAIPIQGCGEFVSYSDDVISYPLSVPVGFKTELDRAPALMDRFAEFMVTDQAKASLLNLGLAQLKDQTENNCG